MSGVRAVWLRRTVLAIVCLGAVVVLLNNEVLPLGAVRAEDLSRDYGLLTWNLWATTEAALKLESPYHTRLLFHPLGSNLAAHTLGPGFVPVGLLARAITGGRPDYPLHAHRLAIVCCFTLGMLLAFRALRALGAGPLAALAGGTGWTFAASWRLMVANQTLVSACFLLPAVTLAVLGLLRGRSTGRAAILAALTGGGVYFSEYYSAFIALALAVVAIAALATADTRQGLLACLSSVKPPGLAISMATGLLVTLPFLSAWLGSEGRPPRERQIVTGGANLAGFIVPDPGLTPLYRSEAVARLHERITRGRGPFLGLPTLLLAGVGIASARGPLRRILVALALVFLVLALGPVLRVLGTNTGLPLPYAALTQVPPFEMARDPQRLAVFAVWALVSLASLGLTALAGRLTRRFGPAAGTALGLLALAWWAAEGYCPGPPPVRFTPTSELYRLPPGAVADVPLNITDGLAMFLQVFHGRPIVTGYVSRVSPRQFEHVSRLQTLLDDDPAQFALEMQHLGVGSVLLHPGTPDATADALLHTGLHVLDLRKPGLIPDPGY